MTENAIPTSRVRHSTIVLALRDAESRVHPTLARLCAAAPPPLECARFLSVCIGASSIVSAAFTLLKEPNVAALALRTEVQALARACIAEYESRGEPDADDGLEGRYLAHPAWAALSACGELDEVGLHPATVALGIEWCLSFATGKPMAAAFCSGARGAVSDQALLGIPLLDLLRENEGTKPPHWIKFIKKRVVDFLVVYDSAPPAPEPPRSFEDQARAELRHRAAFASYRRRAGILDDTCLSRRQLDEAMTHASPDIFDTLQQRRAALWITGFSGLFAANAHRIPLVESRPEDWAVCYDVRTGLLHRDYGCIAPDAARARTGEHAPASFCCATPAPAEVQSELARAADVVVEPRTLGDLIPQLRQLTPSHPLYPDLSDLAPTFARWVRTLAPFGLQTGIDSLLTAILGGDFGITCRSKLHYCLVSHDEIYTAAALLYKALGWGVPVPMPSQGVSFGAAVVPTANTIRRLDTIWARWVEQVRPAKRLASEGQLLEFHNRFVRAFAARLKVWISLRRATEFSILASIDEGADLCVDLIEKISAGRVGAMPAVICDEMRAGLVNYRTHCAAMHHRLRTFGWSGAVIEWLEAVAQHEDVPLLCTISSRRGPRPVGTDELLKLLPEAIGLAPDFGRKFAENFLRSTGARWNDTDRHQRHEVKGQEQDTSVADGSEEEWVARLKPHLDAMSQALFKTPLSGLHRQRGAE